jgi:hypothetical protein
MICAACCYSIAVWAEGNTADWRGVPTQAGKRNSVIMIVNQIDTIEEIMNVVIAADAGQDAVAWI